VLLGQLQRGCHLSERQFLAAGAKQLQHVQHLGGRVHQIGVNVAGHRGSRISRLPVQTMFSLPAAFDGASNFAGAEVRRQPEMWA
jgi:hypothetical protein